MDSSVGHFSETGNLQTGTYYFDPPLDEYEMRTLYNLFHPTVKYSNKVINPLVVPDDRLSGERKLLWLDVSTYNKLTGWQNVVESEDSYGTYILKDLESIKRWDLEFNGELKKPFRNGRDFLKFFDVDFDTENMFDQLNENQEDEFEWLNTEEPTNHDLMGVLNVYFEDQKYPYRIQYDNGYDIVDDSGIYSSYDNLTFAEIEKETSRQINNLKERYLGGGAPSTRVTLREYEALYKALSHFF